MKRILLLTAMAIITLVLPFTANAQSKKAKTKSSSQPITTQTAITESGQKALLKSNGTWEYVNSEVAVSNTPKRESSSLKLEAGIVYRSGDVTPISRTTFYLLDKSLFQSLYEGKLKDSKGEIVTTQKNIYITYAFACNYVNLSDRETDVYNSVLSLLKPHVIQSVTTGFKGEATFNSIPPGKYYIAGFSNISQNAMVWDVEVNLLPGSNSFTIDQNNFIFTTTMRGR